MNKNFSRAIVWTVLVLVLSLSTYYIYKIFVTNAFKDEIEQEKRISQEYDGSVGKLNLIQRRIDNLDNFTIEDNRYALFIPDGFNRQDILLNYVEKPLLLSEAELINVSDTEGMPSNIKWSTPGNSNNIKGVKITINFYVNSLDDIETYINHLQDSVRLVYIGSIRYSLPTTDTQKIRVTMEYYLFYRQ